MQSLDYQLNPDFMYCISAARKTKKCLDVNNLRFPLRAGDPLLCFAKLLDKTLAIY